MAKYVIKKTSDNEYRFNLKANNGEIILTSETYNTMALAHRGIESVKRNSSDDSKFHRKEARNGQYRFNLMATNGQVIGTSETYTTKQGMEKGIEAVKRIANEADIVDQSQPVTAGHAKR